MNPQVAEQKVVTNQETNQPFPGRARSTRECSTGPALGHSERQPALGHFETTIEWPLHYGESWSLARLSPG